MDNPRLQAWIDRIDTELVRLFAKKDLSSNPLDRAMEYTALAGGKRLRPLLTMVACAECGGDADAALPMALASELLHTYSLIHDDLPCMDDDAMRRGKPANHVIFGEANAILAGDALQAEAFRVLATAPCPGLDPARRVRIIAEFAETAGRAGLVAGQVMDLGDAGKATDLERLEQLHRRKTGKLLRFCVRLGGHAAGAGEAVMDGLTRYAEAVGLLFQVVDDLLDEEGDGAALGKTPGKDARQAKATFPKLMGAAKAHAYADRLLAEASEALAALPQAAPLLAEIARYIRRRDY